MPRPSRFHSWILRVPIVVLALAGLVGCGGGGSGSGGASPSVPPVIAYSPSSFAFTVGAVITPILPISTGGVATSWSIVPTLPAGLHFSASTGGISGTPTGVAAATDYVVTAANGAGSDTAGLHIAVKDAAVAHWTLSFDLNGSGATGAPPAQNVADGGTAAAPASVPARTGFTFTGWYRESGCTTPWDFEADTVTRNLTLYAGWTALPPPSPGQVDSLEFGHTSGGKDYCDPVSLPGNFGNGALFSVWTRIPQTLVAPPAFTKLRGNMNVFFLNGDNWGLICLVGNIDGYPDGYALYNANFMLDAGNGSWGGDYCTYLTLERDRLPLATVNDWVWVAWQVVVNADHTMTLRQWLKFGMSGAVFAAGQWDIQPPGEETVSLPGWNPSPPRSFRIGDDNTWSGVNTGPNSYLCHARMQARSSKPTLGELEAIARLSAADGTAWGDWELDWKNGAPDLSDRSGHGHGLTVQPGGALHRGVLSPVFP